MAQTITVKPVVKERPLITIEFAPKIHPSEAEYSYPHPQFVFGDRVELINSFPNTEYTVYALELIESKTPSGKLLNQPRWKYKISNGEVSYCKDETALVRCKNQQAQTICADCQHFENFHERERGWCQLFNHQSRTHHIKTNDCIVSGALETEQAFLTEKIIDEADLPYPEFQPGSIVKVIDTEENHEEWAVFEVTEIKHNACLHEDLESYLNGSEWYYLLVSQFDSNGFGKSIWVAQNDICHFEQSHLISTDDIF